MEESKQTKKEILASGLAPDIIKELARLKGISPSTLGLAIVKGDREVRRAALRLALSEEDAAAIIAGQPFLGTLGNKEAGVAEGAPMDERNLIAYNTVRESCFLLASWKKSVVDFYDWQRRRQEGWSAVYDLQEIIESIPLALEEDQLTKFREMLRTSIKTTGLAGFLEEEATKELEKEFELAVYRSLLEKTIVRLIGGILEDEFDFYGAEVDEDYIRHNCPVLWRILQFAVRTVIFRSKSLQSRGFEAQELGAVTKPERMEREIRSPQEVDQQTWGDGL